MARTDLELANAFPSAVRRDALIALSALPEPFLPLDSRFSVRVAGEAVLMPTRIYYDVALIDTHRLSSLQTEIVDCLLTRHHNGFVRQKYLERIVRSANVWVPPFVVQLVGEYVIEILQFIGNNLSSLNTPAYEQFVQSNPEFIALTECRVMSYWNEYYRRSHPDRDNYVGFRLMRFLKALAKDDHSI
jgi:hypothetical protein